MSLLYLSKTHKKPTRHNQARAAARYIVRMKRLRLIHSGAYARAKAVANLTLRKSQARHDK